MKNNKVVFIACYMGKLPVYIHIFLKSCSTNKNFDFFLVTDQEFGVLLPDNVYLLKLSLQDISKLATNNIGIEINISHAYKLCDFKPAYGAIFFNYIKNYEFWGHIDIDIVLGDIESFIDDSILDSFDVISVRPEYISGFFAIYRNVEKINFLFKLSKDYIKVFQNNEHYCFDECNFLWIPLLNGFDINELQSDIDSMTHLVKRLDKNGYIKAYFDLHVLEGIVEDLEWHNGCLETTDFEVLLYHMIAFKRLSNKYIPKKNWNEFSSRFTICDRTITDENDSLLFNQIKKTMSSVFARSEFFSQEIKFNLLLIYSKYLSKQNTVDEILFNKTFYFENRTLYFKLENKQLYIVYSMYNYNNYITSISFKVRQVSKHGYISSDGKFTLTTMRTQNIILSIFVKFMHSSSYTFSLKE